MRPVTEFERIGVAVASGTAGQIEAARTRPGVTYLEGNSPIELPRRDVQHRHPRRRGGRHPHRRRRQAARRQRASRSRSSTPASTRPTPTSRTPTAAAPSSPTSRASASTSRHQHRLRRAGARLRRHRHPLRRRPRHPRQRHRRRPADHADRRRRAPGRRARRQPGVDLHRRGAADPRRRLGAELGAREPRRTRAAPASRPAPARRSRSPTTPTARPAAARSTRIRHGQAAARAGRRRRRHRLGRRQRRRRRLGVADQPARPGPDRRHPLGRLLLRPGHRHPRRHGQRFSSRGVAADPSTWPDISAPGENINSSCRPYLPICSTGLAPSNGPGPLDIGTFNTISGTSMAAPHIAGIVAQLFQADPTATPARDRGGAEGHGVPVHRRRGLQAAPAGYTTSFDKGNGLVDVVAAVAPPVEGPALPPTTRTLAAGPCRGPGPRPVPRGTRGEPTRGPAVERRA